MFFKYIANVSARTKKSSVSAMWASKSKSTRSSSSKGLLPDECNGGTDVFAV